jgi:hypothetical protein
MNILRRTTYRTADVIHHPPARSAESFASQVRNNTRVDETFANIEIVDVAGQGVQPNDAIHAVGADRVVDDTT